MDTTKYKAVKLGSIPDGVSPTGVVKSYLHRYWFLYGTALMLCLFMYNENREKTRSSMEIKPGDNQQKQQFLYFCFRIIIFVHRMFAG